MSTLPIFDYGAPVEDGDVLDAGGAPVGPAAEIASKVPTSVSSERGSAIVPPFGADDLVSRAQWQWAIGESDVAGKTGGPTNGGVSTAPDASPVTTKKRPTQRPKPNPSKDAAGLKNQSVKLPPPTSAHQTSHPSASAAEQAIAKVVVTEARGKLNVVDRLLEDKPVECGDEEYHAVETSAEALRKLARLVKPLTGEEFMSACEERCLTGKCGWPLCAVPLKTAKRGMNGGFLGNSNDSRETSVRGTFRERRKIGGENGAAGAVVGGRGTYRIDALHRKVYLREDLEMFCCATHRSAAEALGVSLALSLDPSPTTTTTKKDTDGTGNKNAETDLMTAANLEKAKAMSDANKHVKAGVFERKAPVVVERSVSSGVVNSPTSAASANFEGLGGLGKKAASAVEGFVPREARAGSNTKTKTKTKTKQQVFFATASEQPLGAKNTSMVGPRKHPVSEPPSQETKHQPPPGLPPNDDGMVASSLNPRALDSFVERRAGPDDSSLSTDETASDAHGNATFYFSVFGEGTENATKAGNLMGTFSEGQISRVIPEAAAIVLGLHGGGDTNETADDELDGDGDSENAGDAANEKTVAAALKAATIAAEIASAAGDAAAVALAEAALEKARHALKATLTKVRGERISNGDTQDTDADVSDAEETDDDDTDAAGIALAPSGAVSEFGQTWMLLDGWVTRATFAHVNGVEDVSDSRSDLRKSSQQDLVVDRDGDMETESGSSARADPTAEELPPRFGYAKAMSESTAVELRRALPSVRALLGLQSSLTGLEKSLGELLRTFFFDAATPGLRPERWALVVAVMLDRGVCARALRLAQAGSVGNETEKVTPSIVGDMKHAREECGGLWEIVKNASATKEEYHAFGDLLAGECAKSW